VQLGVERDLRYASRSIESDEFSPLHSGVSVRANGGRMRQVLISCQERRDRSQPTPKKNLVDGLTVESPTSLQNTDDTTAMDPFPLN
jgi:hypothetical protein